MLLPIINFAVGILLLVLAFRPEWISVDLKRAIVAKRKVPTVLRWCGGIVLSVSILEFLGVFFDLF